MMKKENLKDIYPLSPLQEGMLYHALFDEDVTAYVEQFSYHIAGDFDVDLFQSSWQYLVTRHDILKTAFIYEKTARPRQVVLKEVDAEFSFIDISDQSADEQEIFLKNFREQDRLRPFDPQAGHLARMAVVRLNPERHEVLRTHHHILMDGWSSGILLKELMEIYHSKVNAKDLDLAPAISIAEYVRWVEAKDTSESIAYWKQHLKGAASIRLPFANRVADKSKADFKDVSFALTAQETSELGALALKNRVTLGTVCRAIWGILVSRYVDSADVLFGAVVTGRPAEVRNVDAMVGLFINAIPVRISLEKDETFTALLQRVQIDSLDGSERQYLPLSDILEAQQSFDHLFAFENFPVDVNFESAMDEGHYGLNIEGVERFEHTHYDLSVAVNPGPCLDVSFSFNSAVYAKAQIERMGEHFCEVIRAVLNNTDIVVDEINILPPHELNKVVEQFNATAVEFPKDKTLDELFTQQVDQAPENQAICWDDQSLSYGELNAQANALAGVLKDDYGVACGDRVAVFLGRSKTLVLSFLAILKCGAVYVPLDPSTPPQRTGFILDDSEAKAVLTDATGAQDLTISTPIVNLDNLGEELERDAPALPLRAKPNSLAYIIYTSGSTGTPKGVMIEHASAVNMVAWHQRHYKTDSQSRATLYASPAFDASIWEILPYLLAGACLYPLSDFERTDTQKLIAFYVDHNITHSFVPPGLCEDICEHHNGRLSGKIKLLTGGDVLKGIGKGDLSVFNNYGPTEATVVTTSGPVSHKQELGTISIGKPIDNVNVFILDKAQRPMPMGAVGELYIGGAALSRGYLNRADLTEQSFVPHPFATGQRLYKTGDLGRWADDGVIYFHGRNDDQIQLRGYRVERGEVEMCLQQHPAISAAVVVPFVAASQDTELVGYYVLSKPISEADLRAQLGEFLPAYMIPRSLIVLDKMPLTERDKIDKAALLTLGARAQGNTPDFVAPQDEYQQGLSEIWQDILGLKSISIHDDFFAIGGHSLSATRIMSRIRGRFQVEIPFGTLFENPTLAKLAARIKDAEQKPSQQPIRPAITRSARRERPPIV